MRLKLLFPFFIVAQFLSGQSFTPVPHFNAFAGVGVGSIALTDVNGDDHPDIVITGPTAKLYFNNGRGQFLEIMPAPFANVKESSMAMADVNGDDHPDVLLTGRNSSKAPVSKLYLNDGLGQFTEVADTPFAGVESGAVAIGDVNGDQYPDVLITGQGSATRITKLYTNDGTGQFTEMTDTPFASLNFSSIALADVNGDQYPDVLLSGDTGLVMTTEGPVSDYARVTKLYTNDGAGHFTEVLDTPFEGVASGSITITDVNDDTYPDVLLTGKKFFGPQITKLYTNDGVGHFTEVMDTPFAGISDGAIALADVNGDHHPDVLLAGKWDGQTRVTKLYTNDGTGQFAEMTNTPFEDLADGAIAIEDVNGDRHADVCIMGANSSGVKSLKLYTNDGLGHFKEMEEVPFESVYLSSIAMTDVNGDHHPDVFITGGNGFSTPIMKLYINDGAGRFTDRKDTSFTGVWYSDIAMADVNNDHHLDVLLTGENSSRDPITKLYTNDGAGHFTEMMDIPFAGVKKGAVAIADVNNDHHPDVLLTGENSTGDPIAKLYTNDGVGHFSEVADTPFAGVYKSAIALADLNGDDHPDVLITGYTGSARITKLYTNDGAGHFTEMTDHPFEGASAGSVAIADVNNDQYLDVLISGYGRFKLITKLYINDGAGHFTEMKDSPFAGVANSSFAIADVNNDHHPDVLMAGYMGSGYITKLYTNDSRGHFTEVADTPFVGVSFSSVALADVNGDDYPDVLLTGFADSAPMTRLYLNEGN